MKEITKPNDILVATLTAPEASTLDLLRNNLNADNTALLSKEEYKNTPLIKKQFTKNGVFDDATFDKVYQVAAQKYWALDDDQLFDNLAKTLEYGENSRYAPLGSKKRDVTPTPSKVRNPLKQQMSIEGLGQISDPDKTPQEVAQSHLIWDPEHKKWLDETAENRNLASKFFGQSLAYAKYSVDGMQENPVTGEMGYHQKGEFIADKDGNYFTELLGKDDVLDKEVVSVWDTLTPEDSIANKIDFMDSDGQDKSIAGTAVKIAARTIPYLIPGVGPFYKALVTLTYLGQSLPSFYKAMESLVTGENPSQFAKGATQVENWFRKFKQGQSQHAKDSFVSFEGIGNLLADSFGQLYQQRAVASLAKFKYKIPDKLNGAADIAKYKEVAEQQAKLAKAMSLGYMTLVSVADVYNDALQSGYDRTTAGIASLASSALLFGVMNFNESANGLGTWFLDKTTGYDRELLRAPVAKQAKALYKDLQKGVQESLTDKAAGKKSIAKALSKFKVKALDNLDDIFRIGSEDIWKGMIAEGVEEVTEEVAQDAIKGIVDACSYLGWTGKKGSFGGWDNVFSKEGLSRYVQTFLGGALGGGVFAIQNTKIEPALIRAFKDPNYVTPNKKAMDQDILDLVVAGRGDELVEELDKHTRKIFSDKRAATGYLDADGNVQDLKAEGQKTQSDMVIQTAIDHVRAIQKFVDDTFKYSMDPNVAKLRTEDGFSEEFSKLFKENLKTKDAEAYLLGKFKKQLLDTKAAHDQYVSAQEADKAETTSEKAISTKSLKQIYEDNVKSLQGFFDGKAFIDSYKEIQLLTNPALLRNIQGLTLEQFYDTFYKSDTWKKELNELPETSKDPTVLTQEKVRSKYEIYDQMSMGTTETAIDTIPVYREFLDKLHALADTDTKAFINNAHKNALVKAISASKQMSDVVEQIIDNMQAEDFFSEDQMEDKTEEQIEAATEICKTALKNSVKGEATEQDVAVINVQKLNGALNALRSQNLVELIKAHPRAFTLAQRLGVDYASKLINEDAIELTGWNSEQEKVLRQMINKEFAQSHLVEFNAENIAAIINNVKNALADTDNFFSERIRKLQTPDESVGVTATTLGDINVNVDQINAKAPTFKQLQINNILDLVGTDEYMSKDLYDAILGFYQNQAIEVINFVYEDFTSNETERTNTIDAILQGDFTALKSIIDKTYSFPPLTDAQTNKILSMLRGSDVNVSDATNDNIGEKLAIYTKRLRTKATAFQSDHADKIVANPLQNLANTLYQRVAGTSEGMNLMDYILRKGVDLSTKELVADTGLFTESELSHIKDAITVLKLMSVAMYGMQNFNYEKDGQYGYNQAVYDYISAYNQNKGELDKITLIDPEDYGYAVATFDDIIDRLESILQINSELLMSKIAEYREMQTRTIKATGMYYKNILPKLTFHVNIDNEDKDITLIPKGILDLNPETEEEWLGFNLKCENAIYKTFQDLFTGKTADEIKEIKTKLVNVIHDAFKTSTNYAETAELLKDIMNCGEDSSTISPQYIMNKLVGLIDTDAKTIQTKIVEVLNSAKLYPRYDQIIAMEQLLYFLYDKSGNYNQLNKQIAEAYSSNSDLFNKVSLDNLFVLLGAGGSGKTTIVSAVLKTLKSEFPEIIPLAKNQIKVDDLSKATELPSKRIYQLSDDGTNAKFESLSKTFKEFQKKVYEAIYNHYNEPDASATTLDGALQYETIEGKKTRVKCPLKDASNGSEIMVFSIIVEDIDNVQGDSNFVYEFTNFGLNTDRDFDSIKDNTVLYVDEFTQLNQFEQAILSKIAADHNSKLIFTGDLNQMCDITELDFGGNHWAIGNSPESFFATFANALQGSWRMANTGQKDAQLLLLAAMRQLVRETMAVNTHYLPLDTTASAITEASYSTDVKNRLRNAFVFKYTTFGKGAHKFMGTQITKDTDAIQRSVAAIKDSGVSETNPVCIVINSHAEEDAAKKYFTDLGFDEKFLTFKTLPEVQGAEFDYVIAYKLNSTNSAYNDFTQVYTLITRGKQGVLAIQSDNDIFTNSGLDSSESVNNIVESSESNDYSADIEGYINVLQEIIKNLPDYKPATPATPTGSKPSTPVSLEPDDEPDTKDEDDETDSGKNAVSTALTMAKFTEVMSAQMWYYRPGLTKDAVTKLQQVNNQSDLSKWFNDRKADTSVQLEEIDHFYEDVSSTYSTGRDLLNGYVQFINEQRIKFRNGEIKDFYFCKNIGITDPLDKFNNDDSKDNPWYVIKIAVEKTDSEGKKYNEYYTIGGVGFLNDDLGKTVTKWKQAVDEKLVGNQILHLRLKTPDDEYKSRVKNYRKTDGTTSQYSTFLSTSCDKSPVFHITGNRIVKDLQTNTSFTDFEHGTWTIEQAKRLGYTFIEGYSPDSTLTSERRKDRFCQFLNKYNRSNVDPSNKALMSMSDRKWWLMTRVGSDEHIPVCPQNMMEFFEWIGKDSLWFKPKYSKQFYLRLLGIRQILSGLDEKLVKQFDALRSETDVVDYDAVKWTDAFNTSLNEFAVALNQVLSDKSISANEFVTAVSAALKLSHVNYKTIPKAKGESWTKQVKKLKLQQITKGDTKLTPLNTTLNELGHYFYYADPSASLGDDWRLRRAYEPANLAIDLTQVEVVKDGVEEVSTEEPVETKLEQIVNAYNVSQTSDDTKIKIESTDDIVKNLFSLDVRFQRNGQIITLLLSKDNSKISAALQLLNRLQTSDIRFDANDIMTTFDLYMRYQWNDESNLQAQLSTQIEAVYSGVKATTFNELFVDTSDSSYAHVKDEYKKLLTNNTKC